MNGQAVATRTVRFHRYGEPSEVLRMEETELAAPATGRLRVKVHACGINPADWALCRGLFAGKLPRGIGLEVSGTVDAVGEGVEGLGVGDEVLGATDFAGTPLAGASDYAILNKFVKRPLALDPVKAAALPIAVESASLHLEMMQAGPGKTILIHGAGTIVGFFAVQLALRRGAKVLATAGDTFGARLRTLGVPYTRYGAGMAERVLDLNGGAPDLILDTAPVSGVLPELVKIAGDPKRVMTISDFASAQKLGVRYSFGEAMPAAFKVPLAEVAELAAEGNFEVPISRTFALTDWREALDISLSNKAGGKLILLP